MCLARKGGSGGRGDMANVEWDACRQYFKEDSALRDIYIHKTSIEDWRVLFEIVRANFNVEYFIDGSPCQIPLAVDAAFAARNESHTMLRFYVGGITVVCHFFTVEQIEFDIDPREVTSKESFDELLGFIRKLGQTVNKAVVLTYENDELHPFISFESEFGEFKHHNFTS